ncbi:MAG: hypothetical protein ABSF82_14435 [Candidatus Bathyarchaeia archaeon]|jgi:hypothetical protein
MRSSWRILILTIATMLIFVAVQSNNFTYLRANEIQPGFNQAITQVRLAESSGATQSEITELLTPLNKALDLNEQALKLTSPNDAQRRAELLTQVNAMLNDVQTRASELETVASQRTRTNTLLAYVYGGIAAAVGTFAYAVLMVFYRRYRIKRTSQMKVTAK